MIRTFKNEEKKVTVAVIDDCGADAYARIGKVIGARHNVKFSKGLYKYQEQVKLALEMIPNTPHAKMSNTIKATVTCDERDTYDEKVGEYEATKKVINKHKKAFFSALKKWQVAMLKDIISVSPKTFNEALEEALEEVKKH